MRTKQLEFQSECVQGCPLLQPKHVPGKYGASIDTLSIYRDIT